MTLSYAAYDEVWDDNIKRSRKSKKMDPACALYKKKDGRNKIYDNIIDSYIETDGSYLGAEDKSPLAHSSKDITMAEDAMNFLDVSPKPLGSFTDKYNYPKPQPCYDEVNGLADDSTAKDALEYERYYDQSNMFLANTGRRCMPAQEQESFPEEEQQQYAQEEAQMYHMPYHLPPHPPPKSPQSMYIEFALFVISGLFLIFIMEQILHLGVYLR